MYLLTVEFNGSIYEAETEYDILELWENAEIGHQELFDMAGVPDSVFDEWSLEDIIDGTDWSCVEVE